MRLLAAEIGKGKLLFYDLARRQQADAMHSCKKCKGSKTVRHKKAVTVLVERGARAGDRIVLRGEGEQYVSVKNLVLLPLANVDSLSQPGQQAGDIILMIQLASHPTFKLIPNSNDLRVSISINLAEALLGFERVVLTHLDGRGLRVKAPPPGHDGHRVYSHGDEVVVKGEGFPGRRSHLIGDLIVKVLVEMPTTLQMAALDNGQLNVSPEVKIAISESSSSS